MQTRRRHSPPPRFPLPRTGWVAYIEAESKLAAYTGTAWSAGVAL